MTWKLFGTRVLLIAIAIPVLPWVFVEALVREVIQAFHYAWLEVRLNVASVNDKWNGDDVGYED